MAPLLLVSRNHSQPGMTVASCPRANEATAQALLAWSAASTRRALRAVIMIAGRRRIRGHASWEVVVAPLS